MIRATLISAIDQAILSALSFGLSFLLIHYASKQDYGVFAQLLNLQSFFSPLHAGVFISAFLAIASRMDQAELRQYRANMARAEFVVGLVSCVVVMLICFVGSKLLSYPVSNWTFTAFSLALLGLWWREFVRQNQFAMMRHSAALQLDIAYCLVATLMVVIALFTTGVNSAAIFISTAVAALVVVSGPLISTIRGGITSIPSIRKSLSSSWEVGKWEALGSVLTWVYAQSYIYFASFHGGLDAAAEIAAGRLLATPLALFWPAYANVLRPSASRLLAANSNHRTYHLAIRSLYFVTGCSLLYAIAIYPLIPFVNKTLMGGKFEQLQSLSIWWIAYIFLTGLGTVAASILRSALQFRQVFMRQAISCVVALVLFTLSIFFKNIESIVIAMIVVELLSVCMLWRRMKVTITGK